MILTPWTCHYHNALVISLLGDFLRGPGRANLHDIYIVTNKLISKNSVKTWNTYSLTLKHLPYLACVNKMIMCWFDLSNMVTTNFWSGQLSVTTEIFTSVSGWPDMIYTLILWREKPSPGCNRSAEKHSSVFGLYRSGMTTTKERTGCLCLFPKIQ